MSIIKIALTGKMRSGKDTVAVHLAFEHGFEYPIAFGDKLKRTFHELFPWVSAQSKPREGYQRFGQLIRKEFDEDVWVKHLASTVEFLEDSRKTRGIVITDLRQPNEYEWCHANGFIIVRVTAPDELRIARAKAAGDNFSADDLAHETERHVDRFEVDYEIANDGTVDELTAKVDEIIDDIKRKVGGNYGREN